MRKLAEHHPARRISLGRGIRGCTQSRGRGSTHGTPGPRKRQTYIKEFWPRNPATGYAWFPANFRSEAASRAIWNRNTKPGEYARDFYVEGKAKPIRTHKRKRWK